MINKLWKILELLQDLPEDLYEDILDQFIDILRNIKIRLEYNE